MGGSLNDQWLVYFYLLICLFALLMMINILCHCNNLRNNRIKTIDPKEIGDDIENSHTNK